MRTFSGEHLLPGCEQSHTSKTVISNSTKRKHVPTASQNTGEEGK